MKPEQGMKKIFFRAVCLCVLMINTILMGGCGDSSLLQEIPGSFVLPLSGMEQTEEVAVEGKFAEEEPETVASPVFLEEEFWEYAAQGLNEAEYLWYVDIRRLLGSHAESVTLNPAGTEAGLDEQDIDRIFQYVLNDHPELFFVDGYAYTKYTNGEETVSIEFMGNYTMDADTAVQKKAEVEAAADRLLSGLPAAADGYGKVKYVYETLIRETEYDQTASDNQNICSVFLNRRSVCQGYAKATQYLLERLGMECTLVTGTVGSGEAHAWNLVSVDGDYYYLDTTWGDASYASGESLREDVQRPQISYDYLNVTTEELLRTHRPGESVTIPQCTATEANYYVREGAFFSAYDKEKLQKLFAETGSAGTAVSLKCADEVCYQEMLDRLIDGQEVFLYMDVAEEATLAYTRNDSQMSLSFWVTNE